VAPAADQTTNGRLSRRAATEFLVKVLKSCKLYSRDIHFC
jgi:hypothetical protein